MTVHVCMFLQMPVWISYVWPAIYTKPSGSFFKVCHLSFCSFLSSQMSNSSITWAPSLSWYNHQLFLYLSHHPPLLLGVFRSFPVGLIIETFLQIAGEIITPKVVASRRKITVFHISVQMSLHHRSCHLLTICLISMGRTSYKHFQ